VHEQQRQLGSKETWNKECTHCEHRNGAAGGGKQGKDQSREQIVLKFNPKAPINGIDPLIPKNAIKICQREKVTELR
jgi:hypothetical protein